LSPVFTAVRLSQYHIQQQQQQQQCFTTLFP
jgi:hypothetical protein